MSGSTFITRCVGWAASVFQIIERSGAPIPDGPVLVVANHPNSLLDPLVIFRVAGRPTRPLAKAPLFEQRFMGTLLRGLGGLPVYRAVDDPGQMHRNEETFRGAVDALRRGDAVQIYPEGRSHSEPALAPLRTGAARIALRAEQESDWQLGLRIVPIGLTFHRKHLFRGRALAMIGEPFGIGALRAAYDADPAEAVRSLTHQITERLEAVTLNVAEHRDADLIDTAERLYVREKGAAGWREREALAERVPRLRAFARGLAWLREHDPERHQRLARAVGRYRRRTELFGAHEGDVPPRYAFGATLSYVLAEGAVLLLLAPVALVGSIIWYPTYFAPSITLRRVRPQHEVVATYKLATAFVMVPATLVAGAIIGALVAGVRGALIAAVLLPVVGLVTLAWHDRLQRVREDARLYYRALLKKDQRERLARDRAALAREFDDLIEESGVLRR
jgi:glycerol-3-phosphate O-acyltransferase / dihydroxyacetone phosphate acyltransferase